uniref:Ig-like domain-containing protein n=1 Tax=Leptobrachium leishanense TaxID=445787 RepID=A0A8C5M366_9ANUR
RITRKYYFILTLYRFQSTVPVIGNSVHSEKSFVSGDLGQSITLSCTYYTSSDTPYLFWYRGLKSYGNIKYEGKFPSGKFHSETSDTHAHLTITSLTQEDSALYLCAFSDGIVHSPGNSQGFHLSLNSPVCLHRIPISPNSEAII